MNAPPRLYADDAADPVVAASALIREQRAFGHPPLLFGAMLGELHADAVWCAHEARGGDRHAYALLCRINAARRMLQRETAVHWTAAQQMRGLTVPVML